MCVWSVRKKNCNWKHCLTPAMWTPLFKSLLFNKSTEFLFISMGTICTWQRAKALQWRRAAREAVCRQAAGDVSASWMPPHALCPWIYGCAAIGPDPPPAGGQRAPWCPVQLASWSCSGLPPTSWNRELHTHTCIQWTYTHAPSYTHSWQASQLICLCRTTTSALMHPWASVKSTTVEVVGAGW